MSTTPTPTKHTFCQVSEKISDEEAGSIEEAGDEKEYCEVLSSRLGTVNNTHKLTGTTVFYTRPGRDPANPNLSICRDSPGPPLTVEFSATKLNKAQEVEMAQQSHLAVQNHLQLQIQGTQHFLLASMNTHIHINKNKT